MARIISGQDDGFDASQNFMLAFDWAARNRRASEESKRQDTALAIQLQRALATMQAAKANAIQNAQAPANMGDVRSMQQLAMMAKNGSLDPEQSMLESMTAMLGNVTDPKARSMLVGSIVRYQKTLQAHREKLAAEEVINRAAGDGLADGEILRQRIAAGESPQSIVQELQSAEQKQTIERMAIDRAGQALELGRNLVASAPHGRRKLAAEYLLKQYENSPTDQSKPGSDQDFLLKLRNSLLETDKEGERRKERLRAQLGPSARAPGFSGMTTGEMQEEVGKEPHGFYGPVGGPMVNQPDIPPLTGYKAHAAKQGAELERRYPGQVGTRQSERMSLSSRKESANGSDGLRGLVGQALSKSRTSADFLEALRGLGVDTSTQDKRLEIRRLAEEIRAAGSPR